MEGNDDSGDATKEGKENTHNAEDKQQHNKEQESGVYHAGKAHEETNNDEENSEGEHPPQKKSKCLFRANVETTSEVKTGSSALKKIRNQLGSFIGKATAAVSDLACSQEVGGDCRKGRRGGKRRSIIMKMKLIVKEDSDEKSSGASDDDEPGHLSPIDEDKSGDDGNRQPSSPKEELKKARKIAAAESKVLEHHKKQRQRRAEGEEQVLTSLVEKKEEETKENTQQAAVLELEEAMVTEASSTEGTSSIMQTALLEVSQKETNAANNSVITKRELAVGEIDITLHSGSGSGFTVDDVSSNVTTNRDVILCNIVSCDIKEEDMTCDDGVNDHSGEADEDLFTFDSASAVTDTKREMEDRLEVETIDEECAVTCEHMKREDAKQMLQVKKTNTANTEEKGQQHEKEEEEQARNKEEIATGEMRKRKREDEAAAEPVVENTMTPDDVLKVAVNSKKKRKTEERDDDDANNIEVGKILEPEKTATSHGQDTRRARRKAKLAKKKAGRQEIKPEEVVTRGIVGDEFDSLVRPGASHAFLKTVHAVRLSLRNNPSLLILNLVPIFKGGSIKCTLHVAECIPVADFSILCRDFDKSRLPPPSARTVYALMALTMSTMDIEPLYLGNEDNKQTALAYVLLNIKKLGLSSVNAIMNELSEYYASLFGKGTLGFVIGGQTIHHQEQQQEGQPPILDGLFDYYSGSPVTVCNWNSNKHYISHTKPTFGLRVAHRIQNETSKHYYVYIVTGQVDSAYAVLRTLLNPLFLSDRWTDVLLDGVPQNLQCKVKGIYKDAILCASTCKQYLQATFRWLKPAISKSAVKLREAFKTSTVANEHVVVRKKSRMDTSGGEVSQTKQQLRKQRQAEVQNQVAEERILAYSVIRSRLPEGHSLHEVIANEYGEKIAVTCDRKDQLVSMLKSSLDDEQNYSVYLAIAEGRLKVRQWISSKVPSVKGSDSDIYEKVHPSEMHYWETYLSSGMEEKNAKVSDEALDYAIFTVDGGGKTTGVDVDLAQREPAQFVYSLLCQYMNPPREGYNIDDGTVATVLTMPSRGSRKIKLLNTGNNCAFVFWCSDEKLITEWYNTLYIVLRLHFVNRRYKIASTNKVVLRSVQHVGVNDKLMVKAEPSLLSRVEGGADSREKAVAEERISQCDQAEQPAIRRQQS